MDARGLLLVDGPRKRDLTLLMALKLNACDAGLLQEERELSDRLGDIVARRLEDKVVGDKP